MQIIPVLDLRAGEVVRAIRGERQRYRPIVSGLCDGSDPVTVALAMLDACASRRLYVADLDALAGQSVQWQALRRLADALASPVPERIARTGVTAGAVTADAVAAGAVPSCTVTSDATTTVVAASAPSAVRELWLDAGFRDAADASRVASDLATRGLRLVPVFGTETLDSPRPGAASPFREWPQAALSLDQRLGRQLGDPHWWRARDQWPRRLIVMTLDRVGTLAGPDLEELRTVRDPARSPTRVKRTIIGAGGIGSDADLAAARRTGAHAWLVASALHDLRLSQVVQRQSRRRAARSGYAGPC